MVVRTLQLNGKRVSAEFQSTGEGDSQSSEQLLYWLRARFGQHGPRFGCGVAQCGACTVLLDGEPVRSCTRQMHTVTDDAEIRTLDGLRVKGDWHPLQRAFIDHQAAQCGFCINGMIMGAVGWLESRLAAGNQAVPSEAEVKDYLSGSSPDNTRNYICRCGTHPRIVAAIRGGAEEMVK